MKPSIYRNQRNDSRQLLPSSNNAESRKLLIRDLTDKPENFSGNFLVKSLETYRMWNELYSLCYERRSLLSQSSSQLYRERVEFFLAASTAEIQISEIPNEFNQLCMMTIQDMASENEQDVRTVISLLKFSRGMIRSSSYCAEITVDTLATLLNYWREFSKEAPRDNLSLLHFEFLYFIQDLIQSLSHKESISSSLIPAFVTIHNTISSILSISIALVRSTIPIHDKLPHSQTLITISLSIIQSILNKQTASNSFLLIMDLLQHIYIDYRKDLHDEGMCETFAILNYILEISFFSKDTALNIIRNKADQINEIFNYTIIHCLESKALKYDFSFKNRKGKISKIFMLMYEIYVQSAIGTDQEGQPAALMIGLHDKALFERVPADSPFLQCFILELLSKYMKKLDQSREQCRFDRIISMNVIELVFTPALFDLPESSFSSRAFKYFRNIIQFGIRSIYGSERLIRAIIPSLRSYKNEVNCLTKISTAMNWLTESITSDVINLLLHYNTVDTILNTITDIACQPYKETEPILKQLLYSLLKIPELAIHLKNFPQMFQQPMLDNLYKDEPNEFARNLYLFIQKGESIYMLKNFINETNEAKAVSFAEHYTNLISSRITPHELKYILASFPKFSSSLCYLILKSLSTAINNQYVKIPRSRVISPRAYFNFEEESTTMTCDVENSLLPLNKFSIVFWVYIPETYSQNSNCLKCMAELATPDYESVFKIMLNKSLHVNLVYWGTTQSFAVTTYNKLEVGCWNLVSVCMQSGPILGRKYELSIYINSSDDYQPSNYKLEDSSLNISYPKEIFNKLTLGSDRFHQHMNSKMCSFYIFDSYLGGNSIKSIYTLGPNYELFFFPEAECTYDLLKAEQSVIRELSNAKFLIWSPRRRVPLILPRSDLLHFDQTNLRVTAIKIPEAMISAGGLKRLLSVLKHAKRFGADCVAEALKLISAVCAHPSPITQKEIIQHHFFEVLCAILQDAPINEDCMLAIFDCLQRVDWCKACQKKAIQELLLDSKFWNQMDAKYHTSLVVFIWNFIPEHYANVNRRIALLMNIMGTHWVSNDPALYKDVRRSYLDLLSQAFSDTLTSSDLIDMTLFMLDLENETYIEEILDFLTEIVAQRPRDFKDESKDDIINLILTVLNERKNSPYLQSKLIHILRQIAFAGDELKDQRFYSFNQKIVIEMNKILKVSIKFEHIISSMRKCLPQALDITVYSALMDIFNETSDVLKYSLVNKIKPLFLILDIITERIIYSPMRLQIFQNFLKQLQANPKIYLILNDRDNFPFWLLKAFDTQKEDKDMISMLYTFTYEIFVNNICTKRGRIRKSWKLRQFMIWLIQSEPDIEFIYTVLLGILNKILHSTYDELVPEFIVNLLDVAYIIEDMIHSKPDMLNYWDSFYKVVIALIDITKKYSILHCTWPYCPDFSFGVLNSCLVERPNKKEQENVLIREGGILRIVLKFLMICLEKCSAEFVIPVRELILFVLNGNESSGKNLTLKSHSNKNSIEKKLREVKLGKYSSILTQFPLKDEEDKFYDIHFIALYLLAECTEIMISSKSQQKSSLILEFIHKLILECKLPERILNISKKVNIFHRREFYELFRESFDHFKSTARAYKNPEVLYGEYINTILRGSLETEDITKSELKAWQSEVKRLTLDLNKGKVDRETLRMIIMSEAWIKNIQIFLIASYSMKLNLIYKPYKFYIISYEKDTSFLEFSFFDRALNFTKQKLDDLKIWKKNKAKDIERKQILVSTKMKVLEKQMINITQEAEETFWKVNKTIDSSFRRTILVRNKKGSRLLSKVNKRYAKEAKEVAENRNIRSLSMLVCEEDPEAISRMNKFEYGEETSKLPDMEENYEEEMSQISIECESETPERDSNIELDTVTSFRCECERIIVKGSVYGEIEITPEYFIFKSYNKTKPDGDEYFGSSLKITAIAMEYEKAWEKQEIVEILVRRFIHRYTALEVFLNSGKSYYFNMFSVDTCKEAFNFLKEYGYRKLHSQNMIKDFRLLGLTRQWRMGELSNFDYLMQINKFSGRSYNDIGQYPVFPWILSDYKSSELDLNNPEVYRDLTRPIGSVLEVPRKEAEKRYQQLNNHEIMMSFHYGSHYSNGGIVSHFLIRLEPFASYAVSLQGGFFDVADRLFASIYQSYNGSTLHAGDYKELVPEFFYLPDFLLNKNNYYFGKKQTGGHPVHDVELPEWAGPPGIFGALNFIRLNRKALESRYVSEKLPKWIDLIFGYKQKGANAIAALNTYCHITYEDCISKIIGENADPELAQDGIVQQIVYYGQTPIQLFPTMHLNREIKPSALTFFEKAIIPKSIYETQNLKVTKHDNETIIAFFVTKRKLICVKDSWKIMTYSCTTYPDKLVEVNGYQEFDMSGVFLNISDREQWTDYRAWNNLLGSELSTLEVFTLSQIHFTLVGENMLVSGMHMDNSFKIHNLKGKLQRSISHHCGVVTCVTSVKEFLLTGSLDTSIAVWKTSNEAIAKLPMNILSGHLGGILQVCASSSLKIAVSLDMHNQILTHDIRSGLALHDIKLSRDCKQILRIALSELGILAAATLHGQSIHFFYINGDFLTTEYTEQEEVDCIQFNSFGDILVAGGNESMSLFNIFESNLEIKHLTFPVITTVRAIGMVPGDTHILYSLNQSSVFSMHIHIEYSKMRNLDITKI